MVDRSETPGAGRPGPEPAAADLHRQLRWLADTEFRCTSPIYEHLARRLDARDDLVARIADLPGGGNRAVLLFAAVHDLVLAEQLEPLGRFVAGASPAECWDPWVTVLETRFDDVAERVHTRTVQTNEVGRAALIIPALVEAATLADGRPLALVEIGPSAGLNHRLDRFRVDYTWPDGTQRGVGPVDATVRLSCAVESGAPPVPAACPALAPRIGIDLAPGDVTDPPAARWLRACLWPGQPERRARLDAAIELAAAEPPDLRRGDAVELLPAVLDALPDAVVPVILSTWVLAYVPHDNRVRLQSLLADAGRALAVPVRHREVEHAHPRP